MIIPLVAAIAPFVLFPIELLLPYPYIIEELAKVALLFFLPEEMSSRGKLAIAAASGILFTFTETALYSFNIFATGRLDVFLLRLILTGLLHSITFIIIAAPMIKSKKLFLVGLVPAIIIHFFYNLTIPILIPGV